MESYPKAAVERAMKVQEVILRAMAKKITWGQAAEIIGISGRQMRRWRERYEEHGYDGLMERRRGKPSSKRVPLAQVEQVLGLYREKYFDLNVRHFHEKLSEEHRIGLSYTWVKKALQGAGLVAREPKRGVHRKRRERRPLPGMLLHIDGSHHHWFQDERWYDLIVILDDATSEIYYAQLVEEESTLTVMAGLREVVQRKGVFCALYSDRGSHFWLTPKAAGKVDAHRLTQVGRALRELGIQMIPAYSPKRGGAASVASPLGRDGCRRSSGCAGSTTQQATNDFLREHYIAQFNRRFQVPATERGSAFLPRTSKDLNLIFSLQFERTVSFQNLSLQIEPVRWRATLAGCMVTVHQHLDGTLSMTHGPHRLGHYTAHGAALTQTNLPVPKTVEKTLRGKVQKRTFPPGLEIPHTTRDSHFATAPRLLAKLKPDISRAKKTGHFNLLRTPRPHTNAIRSPQSLSPRSLRGVVSPQPSTVRDPWLRGARLWDSVSFLGIHAGGTALVH
jgi:transposase